MIKVKVFKTSQKFEFDILTDLTKSITDNLTESLENDFEKKLNKIKCNIHSSNSKGTVTVHLDKPNNNYEFKDFCCPDFKTKIKTEMTK